MTTTTRRELITAKYLELRTEIAKIYPVELLPSLEDTDLCDIVCFVSFTFADDKDIETPLREIVKFYCKTADIDDDKFKELVAIMQPF